MSEPRHEVSESTTPEKEPKVTAAKVEYQAGDLLKHVAASNLEKVQADLATKNVTLNEQDQDGNTPLLLATHQNDVALAKLLIDHGADINMQNSLQDSAYLYAGAEGRTEILSYMLENGEPRQDVYNRFGGNTLIPAAEKGHLANVKLLLKDGRVDIDLQNNPGYTALIEAVALNDGSQRYQKISEELLKNGANKNLRDKTGRTALNYAVEMGYTNLVEIINNY